MQTVYEMVPAGARPLYLLLPIFAILLAGLGFLGYTAYGSQRARFVVSDSGLAFRGDVYGSALPWSALQLADARVIDLNTETGFQPRSRRVGTALPGYASGWFGLRNGNRALLYLTARDRVLCIPTTRGFVVLLSPVEPQAMLADLKRRAARTGGVSG